MPQVTVYIREEDIDKWKQIEKKSEFLHICLNSYPKGTPLEIKFTPGEGSTVSTKNIRLPDGKKTIKFDSNPVGPNAFHKLTTDKLSSNIRPDIEQAKVNIEANAKVDAIKQQLSGRVTEVCPHGYAKGMCKKAECNMKYKKKG